ncbi:MAG: hypothetical protein LWX01_13615, partial [Deltaproteobacteria bacterium]|nr:hypothetical protein [Deltaproteobacteria bacterium]MDL1962700.1 hypothetical protein [Deltaproteobacteria bacterium]
NNKGEIYPILPKSEETKSVPKFWDIAAADILIHEAGGRVTTFPLFHPRCVFTDDTVLTVAVADAILMGRPYQLSVRKIGRRYPGAGYGGFFIGWLYSDHPQTYNS